MERKSIGSFIAALRKSNGLTQKQLAEKLNVSDKAVSRWERDECAPDLSLIPVIAEIFNVTTDELLCGERRTLANQTSGPHRTRKQKQRILTQTMSKFKLQSLISFGITITALIAAIIIEYLFSNHYITLFSLTILIIASTVCEVIFLSNAVNSANDEEFDDVKTEQYKIKAVNFSKILFSTNFALIFTFISLMFFLPFCSGKISNNLYEMFSILSPTKMHNIFSPDIIWIELLYIGGGVLLFKTIWCFVLSALKKTNFYPIDEKSYSLIKLKKRFLTISSVVVAVTLFLCVQFTEANQLSNYIFSQGFVYDDLEEFKEYIEQKNDLVYDYSLEGLTISVVSWDNEFTDADDFYSSTGPEQLTDSGGNVLLKYYHYNNEVRQLSFNPDERTVTVYTARDLYNSELTLRIILMVIVTLEMLIIFITYSVIIKRKKKAFQAMS